MSTDTAIQDYKVYTDLMKRGFYDKLFFIDKLFDEWSTMLDYGCADGFQSFLLASVFPDKNIVGADRDFEMLDRARLTYSHVKNLSFDWRDYMKADVINLSSILHEVLSYDSASAQEMFWKRDVFGRNYKYIIIRDMIANPSMDIPAAEMQSLVAPVRKIYKDAHSEEKADQVIDYWAAFYKADRWKPQAALKRAYIHALLKFPYVHSMNWEREMRENYLSLNYQDLINRIHFANYEVVYEELYCLPYLKHRWSTLGINVSFKTHIKLILKRKS